MLGQAACWAMALLLFSSALAPSSAFLPSANPIQFFIPRPPLSSLAKSQEIVPRGSRGKCPRPTMSMTADCGGEVTRRRAVLGKAAAVVAGLVSVVSSPGDADPSRVRGAGSRALLPIP